MEAKKLFSKEVIDVEGNKVGKIADIDVDMTSGTLKHIVLSAGLTKKYMIDLNQISTIGDRVILKVKKDDL